MTAPSDPDVEALLELISLPADILEELPEDMREAELARIHAAHRRTGREAGMSSTAAVGMANALDVWLRQLLNGRLRPGTPPAVH